MKSEQQNIISGGIIALISIIVYFIIIPMEVKLKPDAKVGPEFFPKLAVFTIGVMALIYVIIQVRNLRAAQVSFKDGLMFNVKEYTAHIIFIAMTVLFLILTRYLGFAISAVLFLISLLFFFGSKGALKNIIIAVLYGITVYYVFSNVLKVRFPPGILGI
jgi:hypothetical protein